MKYPLTGLVRCGHCQRSMVPNGCGGYETKDGEIRKYVSYRCPGVRTGLCDNSQGIPEEWLRETVFEAILKSLFPGLQS